MYSDEQRLGELFQVGPVANLSDLNRHLHRHLHRVGLIGLVWLAVMVAGGLLVAPASHAQTGSGVTVRKVVSTDSAAGTAFNGDVITYTIIVNNNSPVTITDLVLLDVLPENVLDSVRCLDPQNISPCGLIEETRQVPEPLGGTLTVTTTRQISWTIPALAANGSLQRSFAARVVGQGDGASFVNVAYLGYFVNGRPETEQSNDLLLRVLLRIDEGGTTILSDTPTWFSEDVGGTLSMDWGDFDGDGDLDLALGSTVGTSVYRNNSGNLELFWSNTRPAYGVRWADVTGNGLPELVAVGAVVGDEGNNQTNLAQLPGINYVYRYDPTTAASGRRFVELSNFTSSVQMVRVEVGDFNNDGAVDLVASTNAINPDCAVRLYHNNGEGVFSAPGECLSRAATAALKPVDVNNNGLLDLALGVFPNRVVVLVNENGQFDSRRLIAIEDGVMFLPYDFAWGDFDRDGYLDLAAAYPLMREVRIYRNLDGTGFARPISLRTNVFLTPYALDWGDFSGDGRLDLAVADSPPIIYSYQGGFTAASFQPFFVLADNVVRGQVWSLRAVDQNNDGDIDLALTDRDGPSLVISNFRPPLNTTLTPIAGVAPFNTQSPASSVMWADLDGDGTLDLIFGAGPSTAGPAALNSKVYFNDEGEFPSNAVRTYSGFGPHQIAVGDIEGDGDLDVAVGATGETRLHNAGDFLAPRWTASAIGEKYVAWGDMDGDKDLDLLIAVRGAGGYLALHLNDGAGNLTAQPVWRVNLPGIHAFALGDFDGDGFLDIAVALDGRNRIYRNNRDNTFTLFWTATVEDNSRAVAWGDYDGDGDLDVLFGNFGVLGGPGEVNRLYENRVNAQGNRVFAEVPFAPNDAFHTTSLDWGDWDNDGDLDLAVGNYGQPDQIYVNSNSRPGIPQFFWLWSSSESLLTTGVVWGDMDNDGDLDLAISQEGNRLNGVYVNNLVVPSHLPGSNFRIAALINPPMYVHAGRPGITADAYRYSSAEVLSGPDTGPVPITYRVYNPTPATVASGDVLGDMVLSFQHEYSLDGGGTWRRATPMTTSLTPITDSAGVGLLGTFVWDAIRDQAISDNARFRVRLISADRSGPVQRATAATITPPFRVRAITCVWPENPDARPMPTLLTGTTADAFDYVVAAGEPIRFTGKVESGTGTLYYTWDFGDGETAAGQVVQKTFRNGEHTVRMAVRGEPCPQTRERVVNLVIRAGTGQADLYLPVIGTSGNSEQRASAAAGQGMGVQVAEAPILPPQVSGFNGVVQLDTGDRWLRWETPEVPVDGVRLYRGAPDADTLDLLIELMPDVSAYRDSDPVCGQAYYVTTVVADRESLPSTALYVAPACAEGER